MPDDIEWLASVLPCPTAWLHEDLSAGGEDVFVTSGVSGGGYAKKLRCRTCGFEFRVTPAMARRIRRHKRSAKVIGRG
jgi:hypothetical protein